VPDEYLLDVPEAGSTMRARVVSVKPFGAFVHLPGYRSQGLVHISQLAARRVESVEEVAKLEDEVWVSVLSVEGEGRAARVSCSMRRVDQQTGEEIEDERAGGGGGGGGGGGREYQRQRGGSDAMPEQFSVHKGVVEKLESFGAFISLPGLRKNGLLHISQLSNQRIEASDLPDILEVGQDVYVKVTSIDADAGRYSLSMKLCSQSDGRDLDPTHVEALSDADRRGGGGGKGGGKGDEPKRDSRAAMEVPEYGGRQLGTGEYDLVPEEDDERPGLQPAAGGTYQLTVPGTGAVPPAPDAEAEARAQLQLQLTARLLAKGAAKQKRREEKKARKERKKERKREKKGAKKSGKKGSKKEKRHREKPS